MNEELRRPALVTFSVPLDRSWHYDPEHPPNFRPDDSCLENDMGEQRNSPRASSTDSLCFRRPQTPMQRPRSASSYTGRKGDDYEDEEDDDDDEDDEDDDEDNKDDNKDDNGQNENDINDDADGEMITDEEVDLRNSEIIN